MKIGSKRIGQAVLGAFLLCVSAAGLAETLTMPDRDALVGEDLEQDPVSILLSQRRSDHNIDNFH